MTSRRWLHLNRGTFAIMVLFVMMGLPLFRPEIHGFDTVAYYSWLRSTVIDGDLNVHNEFEHYGYANERGQTATGYTVNEWAVGSAIMWLPYFLIAHSLSLLAHGAGLPVAIDGYGAQYILAISIGSALYGLAAILLTYRLGRELFGARIGFLATVATWLAGPLVFYMYSQPVLSHANDTFAYALFLFTWYKTRQSTTWKAGVWRGAAASLCALVRQINAYLVFFVLAEYVAEAIQQWRRTRQWRNSRLAVQALVAFVATWWLVYLPQLIVWRIVFGNWIEFNPYASGVQQGFDWLHPHLLDVLFSTDRGLFLWAPLFLLALFGWWQLRKFDRRLTLLIAINFAVQWYLVSAWFAWNGAAAFGQRFFTNIMPAWALGLGALFSMWQTRVAFRWLAMLCLVFILWNGVLLFRYAVEDVPRMGPVPLDQLIGGQFTVVPRYLDRLWRIILTRSP